MLPCSLRGNLLDKIKCDSCGGKTWERYQCQSHGKCVLVELTSYAKEQNGEHATCSTCKDRQVNGIVVGVPDRKQIKQMEREMRNRPQVPGSAGYVARHVELFDYCTQHLKEGEVETNPSICMNNGNRLVALQFNTSDIYINKLHAGWEPFNPMEAQLIGLPRLPESSGGVSKPRLFNGPGGTLYLSYLGEGRDGKATHFVANITASGVVISHIPINVPHGSGLEDNLMFFWDDYDLWCVYSLEPLLMSLVDSDGNASNFRMAGTVNESRATMWNGAPPVQIPGSDIFYLFFSRTYVEGPEILTTLGVATMEYRDGMRVTKVFPDALLLPEVAANCVLSTPYGAAYDKGKFWISIGHCGSRCRIIAFEANVINELLGVEVNNANVTEHHAADAVNDDGDAADNATPADDATSAD